MAAGSGCEVRGRDRGGRRRGARADLRKSGLRAAVLRRVADEEAALVFDGGMRQSSQSSFVCQKTRWYRSQRIGFRPIRIEKRSSPALITSHIWAVHRATMGRNYAQKRGAPRGVGGYTARR